eukprot:3979629-Pleurochrysis_carterae.AAC.1
MPGWKRSAMAMAPPGRGASAPPCANEAPPPAGESPASRGNPGRSRPPRLLVGGPVGCESASPSGMGSSSSWPADVCARLRREANAGGVVRAASTCARTSAESRGPSAIRPPSVVPVAPPCGRAEPPPPAAPS